jgi:hypothetical protein
MVIQQWNQSPERKNTIEVLPEEHLKITIRKDLTAVPEAEERRLMEGAMRPAPLSDRGLPKTGYQSEDNHQEPHTGIHRHLWVVTAELLGTQIATLAVLAQLPSDTTGWGEGGFGKIPEHALAGP